MDGTKINWVSRMGFFNTFAADLLRVGFEHPAIPDKI